MFQKNLHAVPSLRFLWPIPVLLALNALLSTLIGEFTFISGSGAFWKVPVRYLRFSLLLVAPLFLLPLFGSLMQRLLNRGERELIRIGETARGSWLLNVWLLRPFQGIGLALLFGTKVIGLFQDYTGTLTGSAVILPPPQFSPGRFLVSASIVFVVSILLSFLWSLDDLGVRHRNRQTGEVKMIGKYLGVLLPILFGFSGIFGILRDAPWPLAAYYVVQMTVVLYPPFVTFAVCHALYLRKKGSPLLERIKVKSVDTPEGVRVGGVSPS